jgi:hypothetical protein
VMLTWLTVPLEVGSALDIPLHTASVAAGHMVQLGPSLPHVYKWSIACAQNEWYLLAASPLCLQTLAATCLAHLPAVSGPCPCPRPHHWTLRPLMQQKSSPPMTA